SWKSRTRVVFRSMNGLPKASAVVMVLDTGLTVRPNAANVAAGIAWARATPASLGQLMTVPRTVQTSQLLAIRDPLVALELPLVLLNGFPAEFTAPGVNA